MKEPIMLKVPIGTPVTECIAAAQPTISDYAIILGGPMMGKIPADDQAIQAAVVTKTTGNIIVLPKDHYLFQRASLPLATIKRQARAACIQCKMYRFVPSLHDWASNPSKLGNAQYLERRPDYR